MTLEVSLIWGGGVEADESTGRREGNSKKSANKPLLHEQHSLETVIDIVAFTCSLKSAALTAAVDICD